MNQSTDNMHTMLVPLARQLVGRALTGVRYWVLEGEATQEDISETQFYFGGEIELVFAGQSSIFVSWLGGAGWAPDTYFTLYLGESSAFIRDAKLECFDAELTTFWSKHVGKRVDTTAIIGINDAPSVLRLTTAAGNAYCGSSCMTEYGDGDDVMATPDLTRISSKDSPTTIWQSNKTIAT